MERHRSLLMVFFAGWLGGCGAGPEASDAGLTTEDGEALVECMGVEYPESTVLVADQFGLELDGPEALAMLDGIRCVAGGGLTIRGVADLSPAAALERVEGGLALIGNPGLISLAGWSSLTHVGGSLVIDANPELTDLDGLTNVVSVAGPLKVGIPSNPVEDGATPEHGNDSLLTLPSFVALVDVEDIIIADNDTLAMLATAPDVAVQTVAFLNNPSLPAVDASAWAQQLADAQEVTVCGCLDDPNPVCMSIPPTGG